MAGGIPRTYAACRSGFSGGGARAEPTVRTQL
jgi:hypothetical protein